MEAEAEQAAGLGLPPEALQSLRAPKSAATRAEEEPDAAGLVMPANWGAVRVFCAMGTQWRRAGERGIAAGLDYAALPVVCAAEGEALDGVLLARLRAMEGAALVRFQELRPKP